MKLPFISKNKSEEEELPKTRGQKWHQWITYGGGAYGLVYALSLGAAYVWRHNPTVAPKITRFTDSLTEKIEGRLPEGKAKDFLTADIQPGRSRLSEFVDTYSTIMGLGLAGTAMVGPIGLMEKGRGKIVNWINGKFGDGLKPEERQKLEGLSEEERLGPKKTFKDLFKARGMVYVLTFSTGLATSFSLLMNKGLGSITGKAVDSVLKLTHLKEAYDSAPQVGREAPIGHLPQDQQKAIRTARLTGLGTFDVWFTALTAATLFTMSNIFARNRQKKAHDAADTLDRKIAQAPQTAQETAVDTPATNFTGLVRADGQRSPLAHAAAGPETNGLAQGA